MDDQKIEPEAQEGKNTTIYFLVAAVILVALIAGVYFLRSNYTTKDTEVTYNNFKFTKVESLWFTQVQIGNQLYNVPLHYNPYEVENIAMIGDIDQRFQQDSTYITHDPAEGNLGHVAVAAAELSLNMATAFGIQPIAACSRNVTAACAARPIINCENTNASVVYLKEANFTRVDLRGNCIVIQGTGQELIKATDKVLYVWYRVIQ